MARRNDDNDDIADILRIVVKGHERASEAQSKAFDALATEMRGLRGDIGRMFYAGLAGTLLVVLFLIAGLFLIRGVDPRTAAEAVNVVSQSASPVVATTSPDAESVTVPVTSED